MRLIDADKLIKDVHDLPNTPNGYSDTYDKAFIISLIEDQPTADVMEVKHAKWFIGKDIFGNGFINCSECHCDVDVDFDEPDEIELFKYCPHCGAKMD